MYAGFKIFRAGAVLTFEKRNLELSTWPAEIERVWSNLGASLSSVSENLFIFWLLTFPIAVNSDRVQFAFKVYVWHAAKA